MKHINFSRAKALIWALIILLIGFVMGAIFIDQRHISAEHELDEKSNASYHAIFLYDNIESALEEQMKNPELAVAAHFNNIKAIDRLRELQERISDESSTIFFQRLVANLNHMSLGESSEEVNKSTGKALISTRQLKLLHKSNFTRLKKEQLRLKASNKTTLYSLVIFTIVLGLSISIAIRSTLQKLIEKYKKQIISSQQEIARNENLVSVGNISAGLAHEINQPLGAITLTASNLKTANKAGNKEKANSCIERILSQVDRISKIIKEFRAITRQDFIELEPVDINRRICNISKLLEEQLSAEDIELNLDLKDDLPLGLCSPDKIERVILNLLNNGRHAVEDNENSKCIYIRTRAEQEMTFIEVSDNGHGIPDAIIHKIFDPFFSNKDVGKGTGLGLSLCRNIINQYRGTISVNSEVGKGSTFTVSLPHSIPGEIA